MITYRVKIFHWERLRIAIGWFAMVNLLLGLWHPYHGYSMTIFLNIILIAFLLYFIFLWQMIQKIIFLETQLQIGKVILNLEDIQQIIVFLDKHRIVVELPVDIQDTRPHHKSIVMRPIENWEIFYQGMSEWAKEHHVIIMIMNRH